MTGLSTEDQMVVLRVLPRELTAQVFELMDLAGQEQLLNGMGQEESAELLNNMSRDDRTLLLEELPANITKQLLAQLTPEERAVAVSLLGYPERSIGRLMSGGFGERNTQGIEVKRRGGVQAHHRVGSLKSSPRPTIGYLISSQDPPPLFLCGPPPL
jgi:hypothetical protein